MTRSFLVDDRIGAGNSAYSHAVVVDHNIFVSGQIAQDHPEWLGRHGTIEEETTACLELCAMVLQNAGATLADVLKVTVFMTDLDEFDQMEAVYRTYFTSGRMPARSCVEVARLISDAKLEIECVARASESPIRN